MLKKEITYTDLNGAQQTEDFYFNLTKAEVIELDAAYPEGIMEYLNLAVKQKRTDVVIATFKDLILRSYGEKTPSGKFIKTQALRDTFMASEAYSELFMELLENEQNAATFVNGIVPHVEEPKGSNAVVPAIG